MCSPNYRFICKYYLQDLDLYHWQNTSKSQKQSWEQYFNSFRANTPIYSNDFQYSIPTVLTSLHAYDFRRKRSYIICHIIMKSHEINENVHKKCVRFLLGNASDFKLFLHLTLSISNTGNIRWQYQAISKLIAILLLLHKI